MLSRWLFTTALVASTLFGSSLAAPASSTQAVIDLENASTINLLEDSLPPYDEAKDTDGLLKHTYTAIEKLMEEGKKNAGNAKRAAGSCNLTKVAIRREW
jgi:tyrosinase